MGPLASSQDPRFLLALREQYGNWMAKAPAFRKRLAEKGAFLSDSSRRIFISGSSGSGKSVLVGRHIAFGDFRNGIPVVMMDPHRPAIDNFLDKVFRQRVDWIERNIDRIWYIDMSGKSGFVTPLPMYYRLGRESLAETARRPLEVFLKLDPNLYSASIQGWNALKRTGTHFGMVAAAMGLQITEAAAVFQDIEGWLTKIQRAADNNPELAVVIPFFSELSEASLSELRNQTTSFFNKIEQFTLDPFMRAQWAASAPGLDWSKTNERAPAILFDFSNIQQDEMRIFTMLFVLNHLLEYVKNRGAGRHKPISLFIDELSALFPIVGLATDQLALDVDAIINQYARNYGIWFCVSTQEIYQFGERLAKTLLSMPVQIHGVTSDPDAAEMLAQRLQRYDPYRVKKYERVWMSDGFFGAYVVDYKSEEFTPEEQLILNGQKFMDLKPFQFIARVPGREGSLIGPPRVISISNLDPGMFPDVDRIAPLREHLAKNIGKPINEILDEITARQKALKDNRLPPPVSRAPAAPVHGSIPWNT